MANNSVVDSESHLLMCQSVQGLERDNNQDFIGVITSSESTFSIIIDVATKQNHCSDFSSYWVESVIRSIKNLAVVEPQAVSNVLKELQQRLRHLFLHETASFLCFYWNNKNNKSWSLTLGDC